MKLFYLILSILTLSPLHLFAQPDSNKLDIKNSSLIKRNFNQIDSSGLSKFPLNVGNMWLYRIKYYNYGYSYKYSTIAVSYDTVINNKTYYYLNQFPTGTGLYRYSSEDNKLYRYDNGIDQLIMDFSKTAGDTFQQYMPPWPYRTVTVIEGVESHFNDSLSYKGYLYQELSGGYTYEVINRYFDYLGLLYYSVFDLLFNVDDESRAINVLLYDSSGNAIYYSYGLKPSFSNLNPILSISNSNFSMSFNVTHPYSVYSPTPFLRYNFISSVKFESFYQRDTTILMQNVVQLSGTNWPNYNITTNLDTNLMKQGYSFNYRFIAKDKQIIPEQTYNPDSGYYKCYWLPVSVEENNSENIQCYELSQNFPNPFNPSTKISWQSPVGGRTILKIYDILGREIATPINEYREAGKYEIDFPDPETGHALSLQSGVYFYQLRIGNFTETKKMILIR